MIIVLIVMLCLRAKLLISKVVFSEDLGVEIPYIPISVIFWFFTTDVSGNILGKF